MKSKIKLDKYDVFTLVVALGSIIWFSIMVLGCNAYKGIEKKEPKSLKDTARLVARYVKTIPTKPPKTIQGKTVYLPNPDAAKLKKTIDSLKSIPANVIRLQDSCGQEANAAYNEAFEVGYSVGLYEGKLSATHTVRTDTIYKPFPEYIDTIYNQRLQLQSKSSTIATQVHEIIKLQEQKQAKSNENWFWRIVALSAILYLVFKPKIKSLFNKLISKFKK